MRAYRAYHFTVVPIEKMEIVSAWLFSFPFESFIEHDNGVVAYISKDEANKISLEDCLTVPFDAVEVFATYEDIDGQNWNAVWEAQFQPIRVGEWTVRASFHKTSPTKHELIIDPQMSFGTGHHATTQLMLEQLLALDCKDLSVLDVGTGTGVLAIAAKKLGASKVCGVDIEDWCVENAKENSLKNKVPEISFSTENVDSFNTKFDVILANINRNVLCDHLPKYAELLNKNGTLLLSGFHEGDVTGLLDLARSNGFHCTGKTEKEGWICLKCIL